MCEIEFRIWDKKNKKFMFSGESETLNGFAVSLGGRLIFMNSKGHCYAENYSGESYEINQYTNCKDKNGKKIYKEDIVKFSIKDTWLARDYCGDTGIEEVVDKIVFRDSEFGPEGLYLGIGLFPADQMEIIGNFYENPKLLEEGIKHDT